VEEKKEVNKDRCSTCSRKLKLLGIECKCGLFFCSHHRLPEDHSCTFNHKRAGRDKLAKEVIKVEKGKIESI
jgi:predicted nucleic acid binding AN1-type Zn finger protein